jgi:hypothetical protein
MAGLLPTLIQHVPSPLLPVLKPKSPNLKALARSTLHVVLDCLRALSLLGELLEFVTDDTHLNIEFFSSLSNNDNKGSNLNLL